ncbi:MAG: response regulator [Acidobacteriota bacterium]|nr:response regulator [Acidobacteriota bacterium]
MGETPGSRESQRTVLVVDDDPQVLMLISAILKGGHYSVLTAANGDAAIAQAKAYQPAIDLLLSDFSMPGMSGVDLATEMSAGRPGLKVLLMSGFPLATLVLREDWHFLPKPFVPSQLRALISWLIPEVERARATAAGTLTTGE